MPRSLPAYFADATALKNTPPLFLVQLELPGGTRRWSSFGETITLLGHTWTSVDLQVTGPVQKSGSTSQATFTVPYTADVGLVSEVLTDRPQDAIAKLYLTYFFNNVYQSPVLLVDGRVDDTVLTPPTDRGVARFRFRLVNTGNRSSVTPHIRLRPPVAQYITPRGVTFQVGKREEIA